MTQSSVEQAFEVLGVPPTSDFAPIRQAYLGQLHAVHPDKPMADKTTATPVTVRLLDAYKLLKELHDRNALEQFVQAILKARQEFTRFTYTPDGVVPHKLQDAFPDFTRVDVLEALGGGRYALWVQGTNLEPGATLRSALKTLRRGMYPGADSWGARVWLFVPGRTRKLYTLEELDSLAGESAPKEVRRPPAGLPPEVLARVQAASWGRSKVGYVLVAQENSVRLFSLRLFRGAVDVQEACDYESSPKALQALRSQGISPDLIPVWLSHSGLGDTLQRLGAA